MTSPIARFWSGCSHASIVAIGRHHVRSMAAAPAAPPVFLAAQGFSVDAFDLIPQAISLARRFARDRGVQVNFSVHDICDLANERPCDATISSLIVIAFSRSCLMQIGARLLGAVHARLISADTSAVHGDVRSATRL